MGAMTSEASADLTMQQRLSALERENRRLREALQRVQHIGLIGSVEVDLRHNRFRNIRSPEYLQIHGLPPDAVNESHAAWVARLHPDDRERVEGHFLRAVASQETDYTAEYRIFRPCDGEMRWIFVKGVIEREASGEPIRFAGAHLDITERRLLEQQSETVAREFAHRIKNLGAVIRSLVSMSARSQPEYRPFAEAVQGRIDALFRAKELVRPSRHDQDVAHTLKELMTTLLAPYDEAGAITIAGPDSRVGPNASTALALAIHELATNAVKYGALSQAGGRVTVTFALSEEMMELVWAEAGGPSVAGPPQHAGFGAQMLDRTFSAHLKGRVERDWHPDGVRVTLRMPLARLDL